jgi:hypothetical protein
MACNDAFVESMIVLYSPVVAAIILTVFTYGAYLFHKYLKRKGWA